jgi:type II secretory pathway component GspD/PulD (secretin)
MEEIKGEVRRALESARDRSVAATVYVGSSTFAERNVMIRRALLIAAGLIAPLLIGAASTHAQVDPAGAKASTDPAVLARSLQEVRAALKATEARVAELERTLERLQKERQTAKPVTETNIIQVFSLRYSSAPELAEQLNQLFKWKEGKSQRIIADSRTNNLIVNGSEKQVAAVMAILQVLDVPDAGKDGPAK